jgi:hypothetical protein
LVGRVVWLEEQDKCGILVGISTACEIKGGWENSINPLNHKVHVNNVKNLFYTSQKTDCVSGNIRSVFQES